MSYSFILPKAEVAVRDALRACGFSWIPDETQIQAGLSGGPLNEDGEAAPDSTDLPNITCEASSAQVDMPNTATFRVNVVVHVAHAADSTNYLDAMAQASEVSDYIFDDAFYAALQTDVFTAFGIYQTGLSKRREGRKWISAIEFDLVCAGSQIAL